mmetsp:Transcript_7153/g.23290  ORF Transcript_7153/g.23290 Transcript_7153/m.23290 type:complete len:93 (+) Transcript_7153:129-407(+)
MVHGLAAQEVLQGAGAGGNPGWPAAAPPPSEEPSPPKWAPRTRGRSRRELPERAVYIRCAGRREARGGGRSPGMMRPLGLWRHRLASAQSLP